MGRNPHYSSVKFAKLSKAVMDLDKDYEDAINNKHTCKTCGEKYSLEKRNKDYIVYLGRCEHRHGFNLGTFNSLDVNQIKKLINLANKQLKN